MTLQHGIKGTLNGKSCALLAPPLKSDMVRESYISMLQVQFNASRIIAEDGVMDHKGLPLYSHGLPSSLA